jgi:hypothetical protein
MKLVFYVFLLAAPLLGQQSASPSLAPIRAQAKKALTAEMDRAAHGDCPNSVTSADLDKCFEAALTQSISNLRSFRTAIKMSIQARQNLFGPQMLTHFESSEQIWDLYCTKQAEVTADMVDNPADKSSSRATTQINLIQTHMRDLDKIYNILLHDNCGACLVDH